MILPKQVTRYKPQGRRGIGRPSSVKSEQAVSHGEEEKKTSKKALYTTLLLSVIVTKH